ncbi:hypothetical protein CNMCM5793_001417 [Aspergillus hiratsukae]|uniref:Uncharacterized protein n=1 Tax=Aspergillus hiratsukae TaxID=1194566 RepID=A0A8H6PBB5_9EURO|nr:hypothetical protein CNMCM5793_001417 [Aspergillus hiratsukae]
MSIPEIHFDHAFLASPGIEPFLLQRPASADAHALPRRASNSDLSSFSSAQTRPRRLTWIESESIWVVTSPSTGPPTASATWGDVNWSAAAYRPPPLQHSRSMDMTLAREAQPEPEPDDLPPPYERHYFDRPLPLLPPEAEMDPSVGGTAYSQRTTACQSHPPRAWSVPPLQRVNLLGTVGIWLNNIPVIEEYTRRLLSRARSGLYIVAFVGSWKQLSRPKTKTAGEKRKIAAISRVTAHLYDQKVRAPVRDAWQTVIREDGGFSILAEMRQMRAEIESYRKEFESFREESESHRQSHLDLRQRAISIWVRDALSKDTPRRKEEIMHGQPITTHLNAGNAMPNTGTEDADGVAPLGIPVERPQAKFEILLLNLPAVREEIFTTISHRDRSSLSETYSGIADIVDAMVVVLTGEKENAAEVVLVYRPVEALKPGQETSSETMFPSSSPPGLSPGDSTSEPPGSTPRRKGQPQAVETPGSPGTSRKRPGEPLDTPKGAKKPRIYPKDHDKAVTKACKVRDKTCILTKCTKNKPIRLIEKLATLMQMGLELMTHMLDCEEQKRAMKRYWMLSQHFDEIYLTWAEIDDWTASTTASNTSPCNIDGVEYDHKFVEGLEGSGAAMTAVLELKNTAQLWDLYFKNSDVRNVLEQYFGVRRAGYAAGLKGSTSVRAVMFYITMNSATALLLEMQRGYNARHAVVGGDGSIKIVILVKWTRLRGAQSPALLSSSSQTGIGCQQYNRARYESTPLIPYHRLNGVADAADGIDFPTTSHMDTTTFVRTTHSH